MQDKMPPEIRLQYEHLTDQLVEELHGHIDAAAVAKSASDHLEQFRDARILTYLPILVYRYTREDLTRTHRRTGNLAA